MKTEISVFTTPIFVRLIGSRRHITHVSATRSRHSLIWEKAAEHAIKFIIYSEKGEESTSLVFRGMLPCIWSADETDNDAAKVLNLMESSDFDFVRETRAFGKIKARLSEHAGKWEVK